MSSWWWKDDKSKTKDEKKDGADEADGAGKLKNEGDEAGKVATSTEGGQAASSSSKMTGEMTAPTSGGALKNNSSSITSVLELQGAPRQPTVLALPMDRRPLFPGLLHPIQVNDRKVYEALVRTRASGNPYIGLFMRKHDLNAPEAFEMVPSDRIGDISEVHAVGTFAQIVQMEPITEMLSDNNSGHGGVLDGDMDHDHQHHMSGDDESAVDFQNPEDKERKKDLRRALFRDNNNNSSNNHLSNTGNGGPSSMDDMIASAKQESWTLVVKAHRRIQIEDVVNPGPPPLVKVHHISEFPLNTYDTDTIRAYTNEVLATLRDVIKHNPLLREHMQLFSTRFDMSDPHHVCNFAASLTSAEGTELQEVLEAFNLEKRLKKVLTLLKKEVQLNALQDQISKQVEETISANQRKYFLNEQLKKIKKELGLEHDDKDALLQRYRKRMDELQGLLPETDVGESKGKQSEDTDATEDQTDAKENKAPKYIMGKLPADAKQVIEDEMTKLSTLEKTSPEFNVTRAYLDWLTSLPWGKCTEENLDVARASDILEADHFGLTDIKERILEFIAVGNLRGTVQGKIVLLVGPPGVGKTSIGKSIAHALDREFYRFSVGGLSDVSEIKGHRRTYIGAMPGKLIQCLKTTGVSNPVVLIDEIDKLGSGYRGDPASALLELLDPAQNNGFVDHYIDVPVDLSKVLFVCTANSTDTIPGPLLDRMEVLRLSGYDLPEKVEIAKRYLEPRAKEQCGLDKRDTDAEPTTRAPTLSEIPTSLGISEEAIASLARWYCREAGVRSLEQHIERIYRKLSLELLKSSEEEVKTKDWAVVDDNLEKYVGKRRYQSDKLFGSVPPPGVVMGLAWTTTGGTALYIETTQIRRSAVPNPQEPNKKEGGGVGGPQSFVLHTTGQLGDVMKESASISQTYAKHMLQEIDAGNQFFEKTQIHLHVPEGATPKDGPSAGVTMTTALLSLALNRPVRADLAMTGEISLTGMVLPVGGIKEKVIAARRSGVTCIVLPDGNRKDADELPEYLKEGLEINFAKTYDDVYRIALAY